MTHRSFRDGRDRLHRLQARLQTVQAVQAAQAGRGIARREGGGRVVAPRMSAAPCRGC